MPPAGMTNPRAHCYGIVVAAGRGERFGGSKLLARAGGHPLLYYSLRAFERCPQVKSYVVVIRPEHRTVVEEVLALGRMQKALPPAIGGPTRTASVANGLARLPRSGVVAVHDGARPLVTSAMLTRGFETCVRTPVTYGVPVVDTLKRVQGNRAIETLPREGLLAIQTPQFFRIGQLRAAITKPVTSATDDCSLVERLGIRPIVLLGSPSNIKVTTREDLDIVRRLL